MDANVLVSMTLTDLVMECAYQGLFAARWSDDIHREWIAAAHTMNPGRPLDKLEKRRRAMDANADEALIEGYDALIPALVLPDPDDRHVLAAAIHGRCDAIVTFNLKDFPAAVLAGHGIHAAHPDTFLLEVLSEDEAAFVTCVRKCRSRLLAPPKAADAYIAQLGRVGLPMLASRLTAYEDLI